jgi:hypothetical protein
VEDWRHLFRDGRDAQHLVALVVGRLHKIVTSSDRESVVGQAVGIGVDPTEQFIARMSPLARAVAHLPRGLWDEVVEREVNRWVDAVGAVRRVDEDPSLLRVRLTQHGTGDERSPAGHRPESPQPPRWEIITDHGVAISSPVSKGDNTTLWPAAVDNTIQQAMTTVAVMRGKLTGARGRAMLITSGPYVSSLLLADNSLANVCRRDDLRPWRAWVVSNSLMLLAETADQPVPGRDEIQAVQSLSQFTQVTAHLFEPFSIALADLASWHNIDGEKGGRP